MAGLLKIFYSPAELFRNPEEPPSWWIPLIASILLSLAASAVIVHGIGLELVTRQQLASNPRIEEKLGHAKVEEIVNASGTPARKALTYVSAAAGTIVILMILGGVLMGMMAVMGAHLNFKRVLAATAYPYFAYQLVVVTIMALVVLLVEDKSQLDIRKLVCLNAGAFVERETIGKALYSFLSSIDLLVFGTMALLTCTLSAAARGINTARVATGLSVLWLIWAGVKAGFSTLF